MDGEAIIIVDDDGNEHEFPAGMDPKRAASIVREKTYQPGKLARHTMGGDIGGYPEGQDNSHTFNNRMAEVLEPLAHPQSAGDIASLLLPQGMGKIAGRLLPSRLPNIRGPLSNAVGVAADSLDNPAMGLVSPRMPYLGKMLRGAARMIKPAEKAAVEVVPEQIAGLERYGPNVSAGAQNAYAPGLYRHPPRISGHVVGHRK